MLLRIAKAQKYSRLPLASETFISQSEWDLASATNVRRSGDFVPLIGVVANILSPINLLKNISKFISTGIFGRGAKDENWVVLKNETKSGNPIWNFVKNIFSEHHSFSKNYKDNCNDWAKNQMGSFEKSANESISKIQPEIRGGNNEITSQNISLNFEKESMNSRISLKTIAKNFVGGISKAVSFVKGGIGNIFGGIDTKNNDKNKIENAFAVKNVETQKATIVSVIKQALNFVNTKITGSILNIGKTILDFTIIKVMMVKNFW